MKALFLTVPVAFAAVCLWAAPPEPQPTLTVANVPGYPGAPVSVPVSLTRATNVVAVQFDLSYATNTAISGPATAGQPGARQFVRSREIAPGLRRVVAYSLSKPLPTNRATLARIPFTLSPAVRDSSGPLAPGNAIAATLDGAAVDPLRMSSGAIFVRPVFFHEDGTAQLFLPAAEEERYLIEATTDFIRWVPISTNDAATGFLDLVDLDAPLYPHRFYRSALFDALGRLDSVRIVPGGLFAFHISGRSGRTYIIQGSTNLVNWSSIAMIPSFTSDTWITNRIDPGLPARFFRLASDP